MTAKVDAHPSAQQLQDFGLGKLDEAQAPAVARHLESCAACRGVLGGVPVDSFVGLVCAAGAAPRAPTTPLPAKPLPALPAEVPPELAGSPKFRVLRELGKGGMGAVYLAEHRMMGRPVAIKVINPRLTDHPEALQRFLTEVRAAGRLDHPHIVKALDAEQVGNLHLLVMDYVEGEDLDKLVRRTGPLPIDRACRYTHQAALALQCAFEQGLVHRDIKPSNLMVTPKGVVKVLDFGLAQMRGEQAPGKGLTAEGAFMGTPEYVAPEQATDARQADTRADLYSLGCVLYFLLTGRPPFVEDTAVKLVLAHIDQQPRPVGELRPEVPAGLAAVVARLLAKDPARRYQKPIEAARALAPFCKAGAPAGPAAPAPPLPGPASAAQGTASATDTSRLPTLRKAQRSKVPVEGAAAAEAASPRQELAADAAGPKKVRRRAVPSQATGGKRWRVLGVAAVAVAVLALGAWLVAGVIFKTKVKTVDGEAFLVLEIDQPGAEVLVDGQKILVSIPGDNKPVEIKVDPGQRKLQIRKDGFVAVTREIELMTGKSDAIRVRLEPVKAAESRPNLGQTENDRRAAEWVLSLGGTVWVRGTGEEKEIGPTGRLPAESFKLLGINLGKTEPVGDAGLARLEGLTNLTRLIAWGAQISDAGLVHLKGLTNLRQLHLFGNPGITNAGLAQLAGLTDLTDLDLNAASVTDAGMVHLKGLTNLTCLNLMGTRITGTGFVHLKGLTNLQVFFLGASTVGDAGLAHLVGLNNLSLLALEKTRVSDAGLVHLKDLPNLARLFLVSLNISDTGLLQLHGLKKLQELDLTKTKVTNGGIAALQKALPACRIRTDPGTIEPDSTPAAKQAGPKADYDAFATGRWVPILTSAGEKDGVLELRDKGAIAKSVQAKDMIVRAKVKKLAGQNIALSVRHNGKVTDGKAFYYAWYSGNGQFGVGKFDGGWVELHACEAPGQVKDDEFFELAFAAVGDLLTVYVNGKRILEVRDTVLPGPGVPGVRASKGEAPESLGLFKDVEVQVLDPAAKPAPAADTGFAPLFNGKDLTGWKFHPEQPGDWRVENNILLGSGCPSHLFSERGDYANFHLRVEARINAKGDGGVFFRSLFAPGRQPPAPHNPAGYEAQIHHEPSPYQTGTLFFHGALAEVKEQPFRPDEWFVLEIIAEDNRLQTRVAGKPLVDFVDPQRNATKGHLALQVFHAGTVVQVRKIEIKELPPSKPAGEKPPE